VSNIRDSNPELIRAERFRKTRNYLKGRFINLEPENLRITGSPWKMMGKWFRRGSRRDPAATLPSVSRAAADFNPGAGSGLQLTWIGHSTVLVEMDGLKFITDPVFSRQITSSPVMAPRRFQGKPPVTIEELPELDFAVISHDHYDHLDRPSIEKIRRKVEKFYVPLGVGAYLERFGVDPRRIEEAEWWQELEFDAAFRLVATPAQHFSGRGLSNRDRTLWASWVIIGSEHRIYFSGDGGYGKHFRTIGDSLGPFDMTLLEMAAYSDYWPGYHMEPEEAVQAHLDLGGGILHPIHWGTFKLAFHDWDEPIRRLVISAAEESVAIATPLPGETTRFGGEVPDSPWWLDLE